MKRRMTMVGALVAAFLAGLLVSRQRVIEGDRLAWAGPAASPCVEGDVSGDRSIDVSDAIWILRYLFQGGPAPVACPTESEPGSTVVVVRHGERDSAPSDCPDSCPTACINEDGLARAERLATVLADLGVEHLIASDRCRTRQTLEPTATGLGLPIEEIGNAADVVARVEELPPGSVSVIAHHSFTIHDILEGLGLADVRDIPVGGSSYDNLLVVLLPPGRPAELLHLHYP